MKTVPSADQLAALKIFAQANGRRWKSALRDCWTNGNYRDYPGTVGAPMLQAVRNTFGPSWLVRFQPPSVPTNHIYPSMMVEVACSRRGRPSYRWTQGYSYAFQSGGVSSPQTLKDWRGAAKRDGERVKVHPTREACLAATLQQTTNQTDHA